MLTYLFLIFLTACSTEESSLTSEQIRGREGKFLYQATIPEHWIRQPDSLSLKDTREPVASWKAHDVLIVFHNFPGDTQIAPEQQVIRWKKQLQPLDYEEVEKVSHGGFGGLRLEAYSRDKGMIAYAFSMNSSLYQKLTRKQQFEERSDWTVKATGTKEALTDEAESLHRFVESLELIEPIR